LNSLLSIGSGSTMDGAYGINDVGQILAIATHGYAGVVSVALVLLGLLATTGLRRRV
jgi:hypothetical protein